VNKQSSPHEAHWQNGTVFTVGHSTLPIEDFIALMKAYPNPPGAFFDHKYYRDCHMPLVKVRMGPLLQILYG